MTIRDTEKQLGKGVSQIYGRCSVVLADPPWEYNNRKTGGSMKSGASDKFPTLTPEELLSLPVKKLCNQDGAVLFLWVTTPQLPIGLKVLEAWGFEYKTAMVWNKVGRLGMGFWFRVQTEHLLIGVRGNYPAFRSSIRNIVDHPPIGHSSKPATFYTIIEGLTTGEKRVELFARKPRKGWTSIGMEIDGKDIREILT